NRPPDAGRKRPKSGTSRFLAERLTPFIRAILPWPAPPSGVFISTAFSSFRLAAHRTNPRRTFAHSSIVLPWWRWHALSIHALYPLSRKRVSMARARAFSTLSTLYGDFGSNLTGQPISST